MPIWVARFKFLGTPPEAEEINNRLRAELGERGGLESYSRDGSEVEILIAANAYWPSYAVKILRDLGGIQIDSDGREVRQYTLPTFVEKPWLEHDNETRSTIIKAFDERMRARIRK